MIFKTISSLFLIVAIVCVLDLRPQQIADDVLKLTVKKQTIRDQARALRTGKKKRWGFIRSRPCRKDMCRKGLGFRVRGGKTEYFPEAFHADLFGPV